MADAILEAREIKKYYPIRKGFFNRQVATRYVVDGVTIKIMPGETVALVGESGCGKTVLLRVLMGLEQPTAGTVLFDGKDVTSRDKRKNIAALTNNQIQMIFQDSGSALHPRFTIQESLAEPLLLSGMKDHEKIDEIIVSTLEKVGLSADYRFRYPDSLSGGQRQRVVIARALVNNPKLILADEPISALDVSLQAQVLNLLMDLQDEYHLSMLFVAHDLAVVRQIASYIMIMYAGHIVESAPSADIYECARHPYTQVLLESAPSISKGIRGDSFDLNLKVGDVPDPAKPLPGCLFHNRCVYAEECCRSRRPENVMISSGHYVCCHKAEAEAAGKPWPPAAE